MANWDILKSAIAGIVKTNGNQEITGQLLQNVLNNIISSVGENATFAGIATPATNPGVPDGPVFYIAVKPGQYANFGLSVKTAAKIFYNTGEGAWEESPIQTDFAAVDVITALCATSEVCARAKNSYKVFNTSRYPSIGEYGDVFVKFKVNADVNSNQVLLSIGDLNDSVKLFIQMISGRLSLNTYSTNGAAVVKQIASIAAGSSHLIRIRKEQYSGGDVYRIYYDNKLIDSLQPYADFNPKGLLTVGGFNTGDLTVKDVSYYFVATRNYTSPSGEYDNSQILQVFAAEDMGFPLHVGKTDLSKEYIEKSIFDLILAEEKIKTGLPFFQLNNSKLRFENYGGIANGSGTLAVYLEVPEDVQTNQLILSYGNTFMLGVNLGNLTLYNNPGGQQIANVSIKSYIGQKVLIEIGKNKPNINMRINGTQVYFTSGGVNDTENNTLDVGSYDIDALFFSGKVYFVRMYSPDNSLLWEVNPFTEASIAENVEICIGNTNLSDLEKKETEDHFANLPNNIYITNGLQYNMYIENIIHGYEKMGYQLELKNPQGARKIRSMNRNIRFEVSNIGSQSVNLTLYDAAGKTLQTKNINLISSDCRGGSGTKQFLFCGDSTIDDATTGLYEHEGPEIVKQFYDNCEAYKGFSPVMIGTKKNFPPYYHEGNTGQASSWFISSSSPFYINGKLDFKAYMNKAGASGNIDFFVYQIGINDLKNESSPISVIANIKTLISALLTDYPTCKVIIGFPASGCDADGWSLHFGDVARYEVFRNNMIEYQKLLLENFADGVYANNVYVCNAGHFVDRIYGFPYAEENESSRINVKVMRHIDSVHPNKGGYDQMADAYFAMVKAIL